MSAAGELRVSATCSIALAELRWEFTGSGGPGGQHANTANTKAIVTFDVVGSVSLSDRQRALLIERLGSDIRIAVDATRSQARNRQLALHRLQERLAAGLRRELPRRATRPTAASRQRRLDSKRRHGQTKARRRRPDGTD
jgi:ribosome-associated protein